MGPSLVCASSGGRRDCPCGCMDEGGGMLVSRRIASEEGWVGGGWLTVEAVRRALALESSRGFTNEALAERRATRRTHGVSTSFRGARRPWTWAALAYVYGRSGHPAEAHAAIKKLKQVSRGRRIDPGPFCIAYVGNDNEQAIAWLLKARSQH